MVTEKPEFYASTAEMRWSKQCDHDPIEKQCAPGKVSPSVSAPGFRR
jgi:hypothetical protein